MYVYSIYICMYICTNVRIHEYTYMYTLGIHLCICIYKVYISTYAFTYPWIDISTHGKWTFMENVTTNWGKEIYVYPRQKSMIPVDVSVSVFVSVSIIPLFATVINHTYSTVLHSKVPTGNREVVWMPSCGLWDGGLWVPFPQRTTGGQGQGTFRCM